jgi:hypothetical protein
MQSRNGAGEVAPSRKGPGTAGMLPIPLTQSLYCGNGSKRSLRASDRLSGAAQQNLLVSLSVLGYPLNAGHFHDFKDIALRGVCVSAAEAGPRYEIPLSQRDPETSARKNETQASYHLQRDNRSDATPSTPCPCTWANPADGDALEPGHHGGPPRLTRRAERRAPGGPPMLATLGGLGEEGFGSAQAGARRLA